MLRRSKRVWKNFTYRAVLTAAMGVTLGATSYVSYAGPPKDKSGTQIYMLGTGTPVPNPKRSGPSVAIVVGDKSYLFDFGPGVVRRATSLSPRFGGNVEALRASNLNIAFLTHLHSDHSGGFSDLLLTAWTGKRNQPLKLFGPEGTEKLVQGTMDAYEDDIKYRLYGSEITNDRGWRVETNIVKEGVVYQDENAKVIAFPVVHGTWPNAFGYRIETKDKNIVVSGDLRPNDKIRKYSKNADYLIHEVYCKAGMDNWIKKGINGWTAGRRTYHTSNHTSGEELAALANEVKPGTLVLTHVLLFGCTKEELISEVKAGYSGKVIWAEDLDVYQ